MAAPVFKIINGDADCKALLGNPVRLYLFGEANQSTPKPYAVWQSVSGSPYNTLSCPPSMDRVTVQIDIYGNTVSSVRDASEAMRSAFETSGQCYVTMLGSERKDSETNLFRYTFDLEFHLDR